MKNGKEATVISNLCDPDFYRIYFEIMDELLELFGTPSYFHIGTDEFAHADGVRILETATGKSGHELYLEFLKKVDQHLTRKNIRPVIWHDMLADEDKYGGAKGEKDEPANGSKTFKTFNGMPKNIIINYWCYSPHNTYYVLEDMAGKGFEIWVSPWYDVEGIGRICSEGFRLGAKAVLGTTWNGSPYREGFPATGESAWNIKGSHDKALSVYERFNEIFFYGRDTKIPEKTLVQIKDIAGTTKISKEFEKKLAETFPQMKIDASGIPLEIANPRSFFAFGFTPPSEISKPYNFSELKKNDKFKDILLYSTSSYEWVTPLTDLNKGRDSKDGIIYTPVYGTSTRTNMWGMEIALVDGKISELSSRRVSGNLDIPKNGFVISKHGKMDGITFWESLKVGEPIKLLMRNTQTPPSETVSIPMKGLKNLIVFVTTEYPVDRSASLGRIEVTMSNGKKDAVELSGQMFFRNAKMSGAWKAWIAWNGGGLNKIMALEWNAPAGKKNRPNLVDITASRGGVESGLAVLGTVQY